MFYCSFLVLKELKIGSFCCKSVKIDFYKYFVLCIDRKVIIYIDI